MRGYALMNLKGMALTKKFIGEVLGALWASQDDFWAPKATIWLKLPSSLTAATVLLNSKHKI